MVYKVNARKIICIFGKVITLKTILETKFREITARSKLQVPKIKYGYQINKNWFNFKNYGDQ